MARPLSILIDGRVRSVSYTQAYRLLRTAKDVSHAVLDDRQLYMWLKNRGYCPSRGDNPEERAQRIADHFVYTDEQDPDWQTRIFPAHPSNGTFAIACHDEVLDFTRSFTHHGESWRLLLDHLRTRMIVEDVYDLPRNVFTAIIVPELAVGGTKDHIGKKHLTKRDLTP